MIKYDLIGYVLIKATQENKMKNNLIVFFVIMLIVVLGYLQADTFETL